MLRIFGKHKTSAKNQDRTVKVDTGLDVSKINEAILRFPIGKKIHCFPEFQSQLTFESIVIGYSINNALVFSPNDIYHDARENGDVLYVKNNDGEQRFKYIKSFNIIIPDNTDDNHQLDYLRKSEICKTAFRNGNNITLIADNTDKGTPQVETTVTKTTIPKDGYYANNKVVYLGPNLNSLSYIDQRQHYRLRIWLPATLSVSADNPADCHLSDFSDESVQIRFNEGDAFLSEISANDEAVVTFQLDNSLPPFVIRGNILRKNNNAVVITLKHIFKNVKFCRLDLVDKLVIKTTLLQHPETILE